MEREVEGDLAILGVLGEHAGHHEVGLVDRDQVLGLLVRHASLKNQECHVYAKIEVTDNFGENLKVKVKEKQSRVFC
jgi:hypothetical protein